MRTQKNRVVVVGIVIFAFLVSMSFAFLGKEKSKSEEKSEPKSEKEFTQTFNEEKSDLVPTGKNPFFSLIPGTVAVFEGKEDGKEAGLKITVLNETKHVDGIDVRIVEEYETVKGKVSEISRNYYAISKRTNNVYYFGEESKKYDKGKFTGIGGDSWEAGLNNTFYGLMVPGVPLLGARYYQEVAPNVALDRAEIVSINERMTVPAGSYMDVLKTEETTPLEPDTKEDKYYAPGVGLIKDGELELVKYTAGSESSTEIKASKETEETKESKEVKESEESKESKETKKD